MTEQSLMCNYRNCKVQLSNFACITKCCHIFCQNHVIQGEKENRRCHICNTILEGKFDVTLQNLSPTQDQPWNILIGYSQKVIFDIMSRAIQFWDYQTNTKIIHYKKRVENMKLQLTDRERTVETLTLDIKYYIKRQQKKVEYLKRELENSTACVKDLEKQLGAKTRQLLKFQSKYEELCRNSMATHITDETNQMDVEELEDIVCSQKSTACKKRTPPATPVFQFRPYLQQVQQKSNLGSSVKSGFMLFDV